MCILTMKSMTQALRAKNVLESRGIRVSVVNLDPALTEHGCAYGIRFACEEYELILSVLGAKGVPVGVLIGRREGRGR